MSSEGLATLALEHDVGKSQIFEIFERLGIGRVALSRIALPDADLDRIIDQLRRVGDRILSFEGDLLCTSMALAIETSQVGSVAIAGSDDSINESLGRHAVGVIQSSLALRSHSLIKLAAQQLHLEDKFKFEAPQGRYDLIYIDGSKPAPEISIALTLAAEHLEKNGIIAISRVNDSDYGLTTRQAVFDFIDRNSGYVFLHDRSAASRVGVGFIRKLSLEERDYPLDAVFDDAFMRKGVELHSEIVPDICRLLNGMFNPKSVLDLGCGAGIWLRGFRDLGVPQIRGVDGSKAALDSYCKDLADCVSLHDLRTPYIPNQRFDLCLCLDVAEHIDATLEDRLIESCVRSSDTIIFSSPPPGQGGIAHINERPIAHWVRKFFDHGYVFFDQIRPYFEASRDTPMMTYHCNAYIVRKVFDPGQFSSLPVKSGELREILAAKESRVESLWLHNFLVRQALSATLPFQNEAPKLGPDVSVEPERSDSTFDGIKLTDFSIPTALIRRESKHCFVYQFKSQALLVYARAMNGKSIDLQENGVRLGPSDSSHESIRELGLGRYSMWEGALYFSSSDGSDPILNGRTYTFKVPSYAAFVENMPTAGIQKFGL